MNIYKTYFHEITAQLTAKGEHVAAKMGPLVLQTSQTAEKEESTVIAFLIEYTEVIFGLRVENLSVTLWAAAYTAIIERFPNIQLHDIQNAYRFSVIEKRQYTTLTRDELIEPIANYWLKRNRLLAEIETIRKKEAAEILSLNNEIEFLENCKELYKESLAAGKWLGTEYEAAAIGKNFKDVFNQDRKNEFIKAAKLEYYNRSKLVTNTDFTIIPSWQKIYARLYLEELIKIKYKYIVL